MQSSSTPRKAAVWAGKGLSLLAPLPLLPAHLVSAKPLLSEQAGQRPLSPYTVP